jgi:hypothetical protein
VQLERTVLGRIVVRMKTFNKTSDLFPFPCSPGMWANAIVSYCKRITGQSGSIHLLFDPNLFNLRQVYRIFYIHFSLF